MMRRGHTQAGVVSILVVTVLIVLISLVTIGFSRLMNRETRQALDRQLGLQSYYAAESGVNDAIGYIDSKLNSGVSPNITACKDDASKGLNQNLSGERTNPNAEYSCVLIDSAPTSLIYSIKAGQSKVFNFDQENLTSLLVSWQDSNQPDQYRPRGTNNFPNIAGWNKATGVLRISIYPIMLNSSRTYPPAPTKADWLDNRALTAQYARTFFLYPDKAASATARLTPVDYYNNNGAVITGQCDDSHTTVGSIAFPGPASSQVYHCDSILNCLPNAYTGGSCPSRSGYHAQRYYVKITSLYADTSVLFRGAGPTGSPVSLQGAQVVVDSTGKGNDVLRRINARIAIDPNGNSVVGSDLTGPDFGLRSAETVCKRIRQAIPATNPASVDDGDAACQEGIN